MDDAIRPEIAVPEREFEPGLDQELSDEAAARLAREQYRRGIPLGEPDEVVAPELQDGELLLERPVAATLRAVDDADRPFADVDGLLYVSDRRLLHIGAAGATAMRLSEIVEISVTRRGLLIASRTARGVILDVSQPRRVRVLIAAAMNAARR